MGEWVGLCFCADLARLSLERPDNGYIELWVEVMPVPLASRGNVWSQTYLRTDTAVTGFHRKFGDACK